MAIHSLGRNEIKGNLKNIVDIILFMIKRNKGKQERYFDLQEFITLPYCCFVLCVERNEGHQWPVSERNSAPSAAC